MSKLISKNHIFPLHPSLSYQLFNGAYYNFDSLELLQSKEFNKIEGKVQLVLTSPPYPLNKKKSYGNFFGDTYIKWIESLSPILSNIISDNGSVVIEIGNSWEPNRPVQSLLAIESLIAFTKAKGSELRLIQQFICYNPSRLPTPASWVTINRIRTVDSFTHVWWFAKTDYPKADNLRVLRPYSKAMKALLNRKSYNSGPRPSGHKISETSFLTDNKGAIAHNVFELDSIQPGSEVRLPNAFSISNTTSNDFFHKICKEKRILAHPARMPLGLAAFFIEFLTEPGDLVLDPFGGSNTTGYVAAVKNRSWITIEMQKEYIKQSKLRFKDPLFKKEYDKKHA